MEQSDIEIEKRRAAFDIAKRVGAFLTNTGFNDCAVRVYVTNSDCTLTSGDKALYGRMVHCEIDVEMEDDYEED
ncbi:hypothetical protein [Bacteroides pyogenes]|uniref:hypothetical protein n=1 Tax=Bacteroides pyogenes TaxID=310300 RepID=UPI002FDAD4A1